MLKKASSRRFAVRESRVFVQVLAGNEPEDVLARTFDDCRARHTNTEVAMADRKIELLAPAGSFESLKAAIGAGADAVYMGGSRFGARAYADNPEGEQLLQAIDYAHLHGVKLYLTVNTLLKDQELEQELYGYLVPCYERGLDAVLVQDFGVLGAVKDWFPGLPIHASTQMTVCGAGGVKLLEEAGAERAVLARELSLEEIREIRDSTGIELECFVHGALCYCYSGQCLFSSILGGRSGNRGRCAQPCRLPYEVFYGGKLVSPKGGSTLLSPKDLCALELLPRIVEAGASSLKIEGRMKRPEYTAGVVRIYRKYLDAYLKHGGSCLEVDEADRRELLLLFNRDGFSQGYYEQHNGRHLMALKNRQPTEVQRRGYEALIGSLRRQYVDEEPRIPIEGTLYVRAGEPMRLEVRCGEASACVSGDCAQVAVKRPMALEQFRKQLEKTGNTPYEWRHLDVQLEGSLFVPVQALNALRRDALEALQAQILARYARKAQVPKDSSPEPPEKARKAVLHISVESMKQLEAVLLFAEELKRKEDCPLAAVYLDVEGLASGKDAKDSKDALQESVEKLHGKGLKAFAALPAIFRMETAVRYEKELPFWAGLPVDGYLIRNLEEFYFLRRPSMKRKERILDHSMYTWNLRGRTLWRLEGIDGFTNPLELNLWELRRISGKESIQIIYGRYPMMVTAGCLHRTLGRCAKEPEEWILRDRYRKDFPVKNDCRDCYNIIYNSQPLNLLGQEEELSSLGAGAYRMMFTVEGQRDVEQILAGWLSGDRMPAGAGFTRGHFRRGVE